MPDIKFSEATDADPPELTDIIGMERPGTPATAVRTTLAEVLALATGSDLPAAPGSDGTYSLIVSDTGATVEWDTVEGGGLSDADSDGLLYGRKDGDWFAPGVATESGTSRNIPLTDGFNRILCTSGSPVTALMRVEATVAFTVGTWMEFIQGGGGAVTFDGDTGVTVNGVSGGSVATVSAGDRIWAVKTGSDTWWATVNGAAASSENTPLLVACSDQTNELVAATGVVTFRAPKALTLSAVRASLKTASTSGAVTVDINVNGSTILSTKLTIDQDEKTSTTAATAAVISSASISDDAEITIDIDGAGTGAVGLVVAFIWA